MKNDMQISWIPIPHNIKLTKITYVCGSFNVSNQSYIHNYTT